MTPIIKIKRSSRRNKEESISSSNISDTNIEETTQTQSQSQEIELKNNIIQICILYFKNCMIFGIRAVKFIIKIAGVYILWIILHFVSSHLYIKFCVPSSFIGFIISPFMTSSPHCQGLRWIIYNGANTINNMWIILGTWICSYLIQLGNSKSDD
jgi:hypothetical protein